MTELNVRSDGVLLSGDQAGDGPPIVLLHGLTATRRYVVMGSRLLERSGHRVIAYDARGHGRSMPAPAPGAYGYEDLSTDLRAVLDATGSERAVLAGASMGAHAALRLALDQPSRVAALELITPSYDPASAARAEELAACLRREGVEGFVRAHEKQALPPRWRATVEKVLRQRLSAHEHPLAVADALEAVPRSRPFEDMRQLGAIRTPAIVVGSRDEADPGHPLAVAERFAEAIPGASLLVEEPGTSPLAWQGGQLSRVIGELAARAGAGAA